MSTFHIFYDSNKDIKWATDAPTDTNIINSQTALGLSHLSLELDQIPACDHFYINNDEDNIVGYHSFDLTFSATTIDIDDTVTVTGCPAGTEIFLNKVSQGTYESGDLTFTGTMAGRHTLQFKKDKYYTAGQNIIVNRRLT
jgi:hypothetical protein